MQYQSKTKGVFLILILLSLIPILVYSQTGLPIPCTDIDSDGYGVGADVSLCVKSSTLVDCNGNNPNIFPGTNEACNGIDDNCNGQIDENLPSTCCAGKIVDLQTDINNCGSCNTKCDSGYACTGSCTLIVGTVTVSTTSAVTIKEGATILGTTPLQSLQLTPGIHNLIFSKAGYKDVTKSITVTAGQTISIPSFTYCTDPDNDKYGEGEGCLGLDCQPNNPNVNPSILEQGDILCRDGMDNDCNGKVDYSGAGLLNIIGDEKCPVGITGITVTPNKPIQDTKVDVACGSTVSGVTSIIASVDNNVCTEFTQWNGNTAIFKCNLVGASPKNIRCNVDPTKTSTITGQAQSTTITPISSQCSLRSQTDCTTDTNCQVCPECLNNKYSGGPDRCVNVGTCSHQCNINKCNSNLLKCDSNNGFVPTTRCDIKCKDANTLSLPNIQSITNSCQDNCIPTTNVCAYSATQSCDITQCDTSIYEPGSCQNPCINSQTAGVDAICGTCKLTCLKKNDQSCTLSTECSSGKCVHGTCRPTDPFCGDNICDATETCSQEDSSCNSEIAFGKCESGCKKKECKNARIIGILKNEKGENVGGAEISIIIGLKEYKVASDSNGQFVIPMDILAYAVTGTYKLKIYHPDYRYEEIPLTINSEESRKCETITVPQVTLKLCGNHRVDPGENCKTCPAPYDVPCALGMQCDEGLTNPICVDKCTSGECTSACPEELESFNGQCVCKRVSDGKCGCDAYCSNNQQETSACQTCLNVCGNPLSLEADPDCKSASLAITNSKASLNVNADNVITIEKLATYKGKPVKVKIAMWSKK